MKLSTIIVATLATLASAQQPSASSSGSASLSPSASGASTNPSSSATASSSVASAAQPSSSSSSGSGSGAGTGTGTGTGTGSGGAIISVTAPLQGASYKAGDKAIISWINPTVQTISQIVLAKGGSNSLQPVSTIATNVAANSGSYTWNIPADLAPGSDYAFEFGTSPNLAFTGQFSITGGTGVSTGGPSVGTNSSSTVPSSGSPASGSNASGSIASGANAKPSSSSSSPSSAANSLDPSSAAIVGTAFIAIAYQFF